MFRKTEPNPQLEEIKLAGKKAGYQCSELFENSRDLLKINPPFDPTFYLQELAKFEDLVPCFELNNTLRLSSNLFKAKPRNNLSNTELPLTQESNSDFKKKAEPRLYYSFKDLFLASVAKGSCDFEQQHAHKNKVTMSPKLNFNGEVIMCNEIEATLGEIEKSINSTLRMQVYRTASMLSGECKYWRENNFFPQHRENCQKVEKIANELEQFLRK